MKKNILVSIYLYGDDGKRQGGGGGKRRYYKYGIGGRAKRRSTKKQGKKALEKTAPGMTPHRADGCWSLQ